MLIRQIFGMALMSLLVTADLQASSRADWKAVEGLHWDAPVRMETWSGQEFIGRFDSADDQSCRLKVRAEDGAPGQTAMVREFPRSQVRIIERLRGRDANFDTYIRTGQVLGGVTGAVGLGLAVAHRAWPLGVVFGGLGGMAAGTVVGGSVALLARSSRHHDKIIYESRTRPPIARPPVQTPAPSSEEHEPVRVNRPESDDVDYAE